jgi:hypothetical protein
MIMGLSKELQIGKAGEHLVCCDLITQGVSAFLADAGLPYDVLADFGKGIKRLQVKTCTKKSDYGKSKNIYRFSLRSAKGSNRSINATDIDYVAFVFIDKRIVQYVSATLITTSKGTLKQCIDFRDEGKTKYVIGRFNQIQ